MGRKDQPTLSKSVLNLKFMKKAKQRHEDKEREQVERERKIAFLEHATPLEDESKAGATEEASTSEHPLIINRNLAFLEKLKFGRMSFQGFNPEVERLMVYYERKQKGLGSDDDEESEEEADVSDIQMANTLGGSMAKKFMSKSDRKAKSEGMNEASDGRLNFDASQLALKRKSTGRNDGPDAKKFMRPADD